VQIKVLACELPSTSGIPLSRWSSSELAAQACRSGLVVIRLRKKYPTLVSVHGPVHASWLNQIEIYFSILQRKLLTPNDFSSLEELKQRLLEFQHHYEQIAKPFEWKFTRRDLANLLEKMDLAA